METSDEPWATFISAQLLSTRHMRVCCNGVAPRLTWTRCPQEAAMDEDRFNIEIRKFLKEVGVTSQREIERVVREGQVQSGTLKLRMTLTAENTPLQHVVERTIIVEDRA
jgi:hypothetical protein